jgi:hypothetical protein
LKSTIWREITHGYKAFGAVIHVNPEACPPWLVGKCSGLLTGICRRTTPAPFTLMRDAVKKVPIFPVEKTDFDSVAPNPKEREGNCEEQIQNCKDCDHRSVRDDRQQKTFQ